MVRCWRPTNCPTQFLWTPKRVRRRTGENTHVCLIGLAFDAEGSLTLAANRDEFAHRPTRPLHWWDERVLAGRDLQAQGTWLGITRDGRFAAVTNVRDPSLKAQPVPHGSRGVVVSRYLQGGDGPSDFLLALRRALAGPSPFNLIVGRLTSAGVECWWYGGRTQAMEPLEPGAHVLSNAELNTPWPKASRLQAVLAKESPGRHGERLMDTMYSREQAPDGALPSTGVGHAWEKKLSAAFITGQDYHTRSTTRLLHRKGTVAMEETSWSPDGDPINHVTMCFEVDSFG